MGEPERLGDILEKMRYGGLIYNSSLIDLIKAELEGREVERRIGSKYYNNRLVNVIYLN